MTSNSGFPQEFHLRWRRCLPLPWRRRSQRKHHQLRRNWSSGSASRWEFPGNQKPVDRILAGNANSPVRGIAVITMATLDVLERLDGALAGMYATNGRSVRGAGFQTRQNAPYINLGLKSLRREPEKQQQIQSPS
jgi:hypothetical protein